MRTGALALKICHVDGGVERDRDHLHEGVLPLFARELLGAVDVVRDREQAERALAGAGGGLEEAVTMLKVVTDETGAVDMTKSIYIDWGAFITAVLNFFIVALVLFFILKTINRVHEAAKPKFYGYEKKEYYKMRASGLSKSEIEEMAAIRDKEAAEKAAAEAAAAVPPETQEDILRDIRELLKSASGNKSDEEKSKD